METNKDCNKNITGSTGAPMNHENEPDGNKPNKSSPEGQNMAKNDAPTDIRLIALID